MILGGNLRVNGGNIGITADTDLLGLAANALTVNGTLTVTGNQTGATDHVFDEYDDLALLHTWRDGGKLPFETGDMLNRDRLLRDAIIQLAARIETLEDARRV